MARGGAEVRTVEIFRHLKGHHDRHRYRFHFCCLSGLPGELDREINALGGQVHLLRQSRPGFPSRFRQLLRRERIDVVHSHLHYYSGYLLRLAAECGVPVRVAHFRSTKTDVVPRLGRKLLHRLIRPCVARYANDGTMRKWMDRYATDVLGVSRYVLENNWGINWSSDPRCRVVYDGIDVEPFNRPADRRGVRREFGLGDDATLLIHVGRMAEPKNHLRLISIFAELLRHRPASRLLLVGRTSAGEYASAFEKQVRCRIAEQGISDRVVFAGERTDVPRLIKAADALLFPSLWEGLGDVVLEACAAGTPVLAADLPSIREIAGRLSGVQYLSLGQPDSQWARATIRLADDRPSESTRAAALRLFASSVFTVRQCAEDLCRIWQGPPAKPLPGGAAHG